MKILSSEKEHTCSHRGLYGGEAVPITAELQTTTQGNRWGGGKRLTEQSKESSVGFSPITDRWKGSQQHIMNIMNIMNIMKLWHGAVRTGQEGVSLK